VDAWLWGRGRVPSKNKEREDRHPRAKRGRSVSDGFEKKKKKDSAALRLVPWLVNF